MIDGLKLTMTGEEIRRLLDQRIREHEQRAEHWHRECARTPEDQTDEHPLLPDHMCENVVGFHLGRIAKEVRHLPIHAE